MQRFFFLFNKNCIGKTIGYIENLGTYCPVCDIYVGNGDCSKCGREKDYYTWSPEPVFDIDSWSRGFTFKKSFNPMVTPKEFEDILKGAQLIIDSQGKKYNREDFIEYLGTCEIEDKYKKGTGNENLNPSADDAISNTEPEESGDYIPKTIKLQIGSKEDGEEIQTTKELPACDSNGGIPL